MDFWNDMESREKAPIYRDDFDADWDGKERADCSLPLHTEGPSSRAWSAITYKAGKRNCWGRRRRNVTTSRPLLPRTFHCKLTIPKLILKVVLLAVIVFGTLCFSKAIFGPSYADLPQRYLDLQHRAAASTRSGRGNINNEKIFIAANIVNEELIRGTWGDNLVELIDLLGEENTFVSIYENDSGNGTSEALRHLSSRLRCKSSIVTGDHIELSDFPTVQFPDGQARVPRLAYLAEVRNRLLRPLDPSYHARSSTGFRKVDGVQFDRILFLNDVYYSPIEAIQLLFATNADTGVARYRAACAADFVWTFIMYDSFVLRDTDGYGISHPYFPWFTSEGSGKSRDDVLSFTDAVRVRSCWNGMAAFDASLFQPRPPTTDGLDASPLEKPRHVLRFRSDGELFWEIAECCLIFADMETYFGKPSVDDGTGVFLNPYIRTAYSLTTWKFIPFFKRIESLFQYYQWLTNPSEEQEFNPRRTHEAGQMVNELVWTNVSHYTPMATIPRYRKNPKLNWEGRFEMHHRPAPAGGFCGQRRLFVLKQDVEAANSDGSHKNWERIPVPQHLGLNPSETG